MTPEEIRKLLGGYATGTLTDAEQQALFAAALEDQALFDELAREEPVRELLHDPSARAEMLAAVQERPKVWAWWRPAAVLAMAGVAAVAVLVMRPKPAPTQVAGLELKQLPATPTGEVPPPPPPPPPPAPQKARKAPQPPAVPSASAADMTTLAEAPKAQSAPVGVAGGVLGGFPPVPRLLPPPPPPRNSFTTSESVQVTAE